MPQLFSHFIFSCKIGEVSKLVEIYTCKNYYNGDNEFSNKGQILLLQQLEMNKHINSIIIASYAVQ